MSTKPETLAAQGRRIRREVAERRDRLEALLNTHDGAQWEAAEWNRNESSESWDAVYSRSVDAANALRRELGLKEVRK